MKKENIGLQHGKGRARDSTKTGVKRRYHMSIPENLYSEVERIAQENGTTIIDLLRRFVKLGLTAVKLENDPDAALIIREGNRDRELSLLI